VSDTLTPVSSEILRTFEQNPDALRGLRRGIEKESLRVHPDGTLSRSPHPESLGSPLTHPQITTDFSEAQLELITDVHRSAEDALGQLEDVHRFVYQGIGDELLWTASMPCLLGSDEDIPVGRYGDSNIARAKTIYRIGLGNRYGRLMQTISGIHYNFSVPETFWPVLADATGARADDAFRTENYFGLIRNFRRHSWLLIYLFGASPVLCKSFVKDRPHRLQSFDEGSLYLPHATSLRMGRLGYQSDAQSELHISYNCLDQYARSMRPALSGSYPPYEKIGVKVDGEYRQLNTALLQIENEFYGTIRPKQPVRPGERPLHALIDRGVEYVEVRCLDLNPFLRVGIDAPQMRFLDTFLLFCLLTPSPRDSEEESRMMGDNQLRVVEEGRRGDLELTSCSGNVSREAWSREILDGCRALAELLDRAEGTTGYTDAWEEQRQKVEQPGLTPSARMLDLMSGQGIPFFRFAMNQSAAHKAYFKARPLPPDQQAAYQARARESLAAQARIEADDDVPFETFLERYLAPA
jgi:glutamate--cysteine ligase